MAGLAGIPSSPPFSDETVDRVKTLLNNGEVDVNEVSGYFSVPVPVIIQALTGISRDAYTSGDAMADADVDAVMKMVNSGVASTADVADYFSATEEVVERYLTDVELYTAEDIVKVRQGIAVASADARNVVADGEYTEEEINIVADSINNGLLSAAQVGQQFNISEAEVLSIMENILTPKERASVATGQYTDNGDGTYSDATGNIFNEVNGQLTVDQALTGEELIAKAGGVVPPNDAADAAAAASNAANATAAAAAANNSSMGTAAAAGNLLALDAAGADIPVGLIGAENSFKTSATNAIAALDALNARGRSDLATQNAAGLASAKSQNAAAIAAINAGTTKGVEASNAAAVAARLDLDTKYAAGIADAEAQSVIARNDITAGRAQGLNSLQTGLNNAATNLNNNYATGLQNAQNQAAIARQDIATGQNQGLAELDAGLALARNDITQEFGRAERMFDPYSLGGEAALQKQLALSGALGQEAFNAAYQESPQIAFLREQGMRANLAGAGATGGLGGGNVQRELQRFGQGLSSQGLQQQIANLGALSSQGLNASGSAAGIATGAGTNLANLGISRGQAGLETRMNAAANLSNIASGLGSQQLQTNVNLGNNLSNLNAASGQAGLQSFTNEATNLSNIASGLGTQQLQTQLALGNNLSNNRTSQGQDQLAAYTAQGSNLSNLATGLGSQQLNTQAALGSNLSGLNISTGLPAVNTINNLGINLAAGRSLIGAQDARDETSRATSFANIYSDQSKNIQQDLDNQQASLLAQVNSGAITQAQAQSAYGTALANAQSNIGAALAGVQQAPIVSPNFANAAGNALGAAGAGYDMFNPKIRRASDIISDGSGSAPVNANFQPINANLQPNYGLSAGGNPSGINGFQSNPFLPS